MALEMSAARLRHQELRLEAGLGAPLLAASPGPSDHDGLVAEEAAAAAEEAETVEHLGGSVQDASSDWSDSGDDECEQSGVASKAEPQATPVATPRAVTHGLSKLSICQSPRSASITRAASSSLFIITLYTEPTLPPPSLGVHSPSHRP